MSQEDFKKKLAETRKEISYLRGIVITKSVDMDGFIGALIGNYFVKSDKQSDFLTIVLCDEYFSFGLKISILNKILSKMGWKPYSSFKDDLNQINRLRNRFAHALMYGLEGELSYSAGEKITKVKKAKEMYDEFMNLYPKVFEELNKILNHLLEESKKSKQSAQKVTSN